MKKITIIFTLLIVSIGFSQELVTNGDFETGPLTAWYGNAANRVDDGSGNFINEANVAAAGTQFSVNLSQEIILESGKSYELSFVAYTDATTFTRGMVVGLGQTAAPFTASLVNPDPVLIDTPQTYTYTLTISYGDAVPDRVIFDMGAETGFVFIDNVSVQEVVDLCNDGILNNGETEIDCGGSNCEPCPAPPTVAAPTPPNRPDGEVVSIYSGVYAEIPAINYDAGFCGTGAITETVADGDPIFAYNNQDCQGIDFSANTQDLTGLTNVHVDLFIEAGTEIIGKVFNILVVHPDGSGDTPINIDLNALSPAPIPGTWYSFDRAVTFNNPIARQVTVVSNLKSSVWYDNLYIHQNTTLNANSFNSNSFKVYPNPSNGVWNINSDNDITQIQLFDMLGKSVMMVKPNTLNVELEASTLTKGLYFATISTATGSESVKLIKN